MDSPPSSSPYDDAFSARIRSHLTHVLTSDSFRNTPQLSAFLRLIVERELEGRGAELKGYTIATEALGRPADFDPQTDPIVRVEAGRLRRTLAQYYETEGRDQPVRITIPVGSYVPSLTSGTAAPTPIPVPGPKLPQKHDRPSTGRLDLFKWGLAILFGAGLAIAAIWLLGPSATVQNPSLTIWDRALENPAKLAPARTMRLAVSIAETPGDTAANERGRIFATLLLDALARFDDLLTVSLLPNGTAPQPGTDYLFEVLSLPLDGNRGGFAQLRSVADNRIVWATSSNADEFRAITNEMLAVIARRLATRLAEPFGIIHADARRFAPTTATKCLYGAIDLRRDMQPDDTGTIRNCLETIVSRQPDFHPAWSLLSLLLSGEPGSGPPNDRGAVDRALLAAGMAVRLAPGNARAQQAMMDALALRGDTKGAESAGREARLANPYDPDIAADFGALLVQFGRPSEGLPLLQQAIEQGAGEVSWYQFFAFLARYMLQAGPVNGTELPFIAIADSFYGEFYRALVAARAADGTALGEAREGMAKAAPDFARDPRAYLRAHGFGDEVAARLLKDIGSAGSPQ